MKARQLKTKFVTKKVYSTLRKNVWCSEILKLRMNSCSEYTAEMLASRVTKGEHTVHWKFVSV